jgi:hypothetical protein
MNGGAAACVAGRTRGFHSLLLGWRPSAAAPRINPSSSLDRRPWAGLGWQHTFLTYQPNKVERLFYREGGREGGRHFVDRCPNFLSAAIPYSLPPKLFGIMILPSVGFAPLVLCSASSLLWSSRARQLAGKVRFSFERPLTAHALGKRCRCPPHSSTHHPLL